MCCALGLCLTAGPAVAQDAEVHFQATREGSRFDIEATAQIPATVNDAWTVLTDYERLPKFIPGVNESRVLARQGSSAVIELRGEVSWLIFTFPMQVRLAIEEFPYRRIEARAIGGNFRQMQGIYRLDAIPHGVKLYYEGSLTPDFYLPPLIGTLLVRSRLERRFTALVREIQKHAAVADAR